ncbi:MAG: nucleotide sugar dehydrogenase [Methanobacteriota archaeon]
MAEFLPYRNPKKVGAALKKGLPVSVHGLGKMGLPLAAAIGKRGARIHGVDVDPEVVAFLNKGRTRIVGEPGLAELVARLHKKRTFSATTDGAAAARASRVHILLVPTLLTPEKEPDLHVLLRAAKTASLGLKEGDLVFVECTVPLGTTQGPLRDILDQGSGLFAGSDYGLAFCPERTSSGRALLDIEGAYPKIVGGIDAASTEAAAAFYGVVNKKGVIPVSNATAAEAVKLFEGVYRDVNIALANELSKACEEHHISSAEVIEAANTQPYSHLHRPGIGVGGHCIPVYPYFVTTTTKTAMPLLSTAREVNDGQPRHAVRILKELLGERGVSLPGAKIVVLGLAYRGGVKEHRYAPAIEVMRLLSEEKADARIWDPLWSDAELSAMGYAAASRGDLSGADGAIVVTDHPEFKTLPWKRIAAGMRHPVVVDGRRLLSPEEAAKAGLSYRALGEGR